MILTVVVAIFIDLFRQFLVNQKLFRTSLRFDTIFFFSSMAAGLIFLVVHWFYVSGTNPDELTFLFHLSLLFGYAASVIVYMQSKSFFSRGYSIGILLDLLRRGPTLSMDELKRGYGNGMGLEGMLRKRLLSIASVGLVNISNDRVRGLTPRGTFLSRVADATRALLNLKEVG
jgi:hypothetical protein